MKTYTSIVHWFFGKYPVGFSHDLIEDDGAPYLERWVVWLGGPTLRLHKFYKGDHDRHMHDHPWNFWTFPLSDYYEWADELQFSDPEWITPGFSRRHNFVKGLRLHYRPAEYRHIVQSLPGGKPIYTLVATGRRVRPWGFWVNGDFVNYREYNDGNNG